MSSGEFAAIPRSIAITSFLVKAVGFIDSGAFLLSKAFSGSELRRWNKKVSIGRVFRSSDDFALGLAGTGRSALVWIHGVGLLYSSLALFLSS